MIIAAHDRKHRLPAPGRLLLVLGVLLTAPASLAAEPSAGSAIQWRGDDAPAFSRARATGRPVAVDFWADWCTACNELDRTAWSDPAVQGAARRFVTLKLDGTAETPAFQAAMEKYQVVGMPTVILIDSRGRELPDRITSVLEAKEVLRRLESVDRTCTGPALACAVRW
jgi:thiol:disulfide interchange protein DsbD